MRGSTVPKCEEEYDEVFGETNTERNDEVLMYELYNFFYFFFMNLTDFNCFSDVADNDEFTLGDAVLFAWDKRKKSLEHAYAVTAWALSLQPEIRIDCMEQLSTNNDELWKMEDGG